MKLYKNNKIYFYTSITFYNFNQTVLDIHLGNICFFEIRTLSRVHMYIYFNYLVSYITQVY